MDDLKSLSLTFQEYSYLHISRSLFKADRLTFAMHLSHGMHTELFQEYEWEAFTGLLVSGNPSQDAGSLPSWIDEDRRPAVTRMKGQFPRLYESLQLDNTSIWGNFARLYYQTIYNFMSKITLYEFILIRNFIDP